jgi:hypothetical protein
MCCSTECLWRRRLEDTLKLERPPSVPLGGEGLETCRLPRGEGLGMELGWRQDLLEQDGFKLGNHLEEKAKLAGCPEEKAWAWSLVGGRTCLSRMASNLGTTWRRKVSPSTVEAWACGGRTVDEKSLKLGGQVLA